MADHPEIKSPQEIFDESPIVRSFLGLIITELAGGKREIPFPAANFPDDFKKRTIEYLKGTGWKVEKDPTGANLKFEDGEGGKRSNFFDDLFGGSKKGKKGSSWFD